MWYKKTFCDICGVEIPAGGSTFLSHSHFVCGDCEKKIKVEGFPTGEIFNRRQFVVVGRRDIVSEMLFPGEACV